MSISTYEQRLAVRLERALLGAPDANALDRFKAIVGPSDLSAFGPLAESGRAKLRDGDKPTSDEMAALELAIRLMRPAPLVQDGAPAKLSDQALQSFSSWAPFLAKAPSLTAAVGRIDSLRMGRQIGTGFLVAPNLVVTNRHVLDALSFGTMVLDKGQAQILFGMEFGGFADTKAILRVAGVHDSADLSLLEIEPPDGRAPLAFGDGPTVGDQVVAVGYPANDPFRNPFFVPLLFGDKFGVQRAAPGEVSELGPESVYHDCSTLGGNSGSPLVSMATGKVVGVHREGTFMFRNGAVDAATALAFVAVHGGL
jgi:S1-C subfamily serine protease